jgi:hypothetical protein
MNLPDPFMTIMRRDVFYADGVATWTSRFRVDGDGANGQTSKACYGPNNSGLDWTANGGKPGDWWALVCGKNGKPLLQTKGMPAPGMYTSMTGLRLLDKKGKPFDAADPAGYVDSNAVPGVVVPRILAKKLPGIVLGCQVYVTNLSIPGSKPVAAVVYDTGPDNEIGEGSIDLARQLKLGTNPRKGGGTDEFIIKVCIHPGVPAVVNGITYPLQRL